MNLQNALERINKFTKEFPQKEIDFIRQHKDEAIPELIEQIKYPLENSNNRDDEYDQIIAMFLLSEFKENSGFPYIVEYLYMNKDDIYFWLGDASTENLHVILANTADTKDIDSLKEAVENSCIDFFVRNTALNALITMCGQGKISYNEIVKYIEELIDKFQNDRDLMTMIAALKGIVCSEKIYKNIVNAFDRGCIYTGYIDKEFYISHTVFNGSVENIINDDLYSDKRGMTDDLKRWSCYNESTENKSEHMTENSMLESLFKDIGDDEKLEIFNNLSNIYERRKREDVDRVTIIGEPVFVLKDILKIYTGSALNKIIEKHNINNYKIWDREIIEKKIYDFVTDCDSIENFVNSMDEDELDFIKKLESASKPVKIKNTKYYNILIDWTGFICVFLNNGIKYAVMPNEVKENFNTYMRSPERALIEKENIMFKYADAALNLYGAISVDEFIRILYKYTSIDLDEDRILDLLEGSFLIKHVSDAYIIYNEHLDNEDVLFSMLTKAIIDKRPLYILSNTEFIKYADEEYFEQNSGVKELKKYFKVSCDDMDNYVIDAITKEIYDSFAGKSHSTVDDILNAYGVGFYDAESEKTFNMVCRYMEYNTRKWLNRGFTDKEIEVKESNKGAVKNKKIGRNDPCPCGSGKKYKKCCGRNL